MECVSQSCPLVVMKKQRLLSSDGSIIRLDDTDEDAESLLSSGRPRSFAEVIEFDTLGHRGVNLTDIQFPGRWSSRTIGNETLNEKNQIVLEHRIAKHWNGTPSWNSDPVYFSHNNTDVRTPFTIANAVFFVGGVFSQWTRSSFTEEKLSNEPRWVESRTTFNCAEQYMMAKKAILFNDLQTYKQIMSESHGGAIKRLGRNVAGGSKEQFNARWNPAKFRVVAAASQLRYDQDENFRTSLQRTGNRLIVEVNPNDPVWAIALSHDEAAQYPHLWKENLLGKALMKTRESRCGRLPSPEPTLVDFGRRPFEPSPAEHGVLTPPAESDVSYSSSGTPLYFWQTCEFANSWIAPVEIDGTVWHSNLQWRSKAPATQRLMEKTAACGRAEFAHENVLYTALVKANRAKFSQHPFLLQRL
eukprot:Polyplicarium_translucidae@DN3021_c0_g1_i1.p1